jgi:hypothetical protein
MAGMGRMAGTATPGISLGFGFGGFGLGLAAGATGAAGRPAVSLP